MIEFPSGLIPLLDSFSISTDNVLNRSEFESGPARQRSNSCGQYTNYSMTYSVCGCSGFEDFKKWFRDDLKNGAKSFKWFNPCTKTNVKARIADGQFSASPDNKSLDSWNVQLSIEVWEPNA